MEPESILRLRALWLLVAVAVTVWVGACVDERRLTGDETPRPAAWLGIVSDPVSSGAPAGSGNARSLAASSASDVVYVSLAPGTISNAELAVISNRRTGSAVVAAVVAGGFDPVPVAAVAGDTLDIDVRVPRSETLHFTQVVAASRRPIIVRTDPPPGKRDVPLNALIVIVFSEPIDPSTLTTESVQLWRSTTRVPGTVRFADATHIRAEFVPAGLLESLTEYRLLVSAAIRDVDGMVLESPVDVPFMTGNAPPATGLDFASVIAGGSHTCGLTTTGTAYCWGDNTYGQLGTGTTASSFTPVPVAGNLTFTSLSAGALHTCGVATDGTAYCWGYSPPLGADSVTLSTSCGWVGANCISPVPVAGGRRFSSVSAGYWHACGVTTEGAAYCWGFGDGGRLGADSATMRASNCGLYAWGWACLTPVPVSGGLVFTSVSAGSSLTCGVTATDALYCWGANGIGQLGIGTTAGPERCPDGEGGDLPCSHVPVAVAGGPSFTDVTALNTSACGLQTGGAAYCWGDDWGATPVAVAGGHSFTAIARGGNSHTCALTATGAAYCWGNGALGDGTGADTIHSFNATPVPVAGGLSFQAISASENWGFHTCGLTVGGIAYCWGFNSEGQLGTGTTASSRGPVKVAGQRQ